MLDKQPFDTSNLKAAMLGWRQGACIAGLTVFGYKGYLSWWCEV